MNMAAEEFKFHVLLVNDDPIERKLTERLLNKSFYRVTSVDSVSKALEIMGLLEDDEQTNSLSPTSVISSEHHFHHEEPEVHLIITDYSLPDTSGYYLLKKIKESPYLKHIPVVIMSSESDCVPSRISRCLEEGAKEFIKKPVKPSDVRRLKRHLLRVSLEESQQPGEQEEESLPPPQEQTTSQKQEEEGHGRVVEDQQETQH